LGAGICLVIGGSAWKPQEIAGEPLRNLSPFQMAKRAKSSLKRALGQRVKELRISLNMSQMELADKAKVQQPLISKLERGTGNPTIDSIEGIATALGVKLIELLDPW
jgi:ribosome-binding protein aMBF1 (putative translation factor)